MLKRIALFLCLFSLIAGWHVNASATNGNGSNDDDYFYEKAYNEKLKADFIKKNGDIPLLEIDINGLKRTSRTVIDNELEIKEGEPVSRFDSYRFVNRLKRTGLFAKIRLDFAEEQQKAVIRVSLVEKRGFLVLPMVAGNKKNVSAGAMVIDMNFLGMNKKLFTAGTYSNKYSTAMCGYIDPSVFNSDFQGGAFLTYRHSVEEILDYNGTRLSEFKSDVMRFSAFYGYRLNDILIFNIKAGYNLGMVDEKYSGSYNVPDDQQNIFYGLSLRYDGLSYYEHLYFGYDSSIEANRNNGLTTDDESYMSYEIKSSYSFRVFGRHRITLSGIGRWSGVPNVLKNSIGGKYGHFTVPGDVVITGKDASVSMFYEHQIASFKWGAITLLTFWEHGVYERLNGGPAWSYGPGAGANFYLNRIALPAMGLYFAHNVESKKIEISFSIGMMM